MSNIALLQEQFVRKALEFEYCFNMSRYLMSPLLRLRLESSLLIDQRKNAYTLRELYFYEVVSVSSIGKDNPHSPSGRARNATTNDNNNYNTTISPKSSKSPVSGVSPDGSVPQQQQQQPVAVQLHKLMSRSLRGADVNTTSESSPGELQEEIETEPELNDFATELLKQYACETCSAVSNMNDSISGGARVLESCSGFGEITKAYASSPTDILHPRSVLIMCLIEVNSFPCVFFPSYYSFLRIILYSFMDIHIFFYFASFIPPLLLLSG
jgi:hypothetical protein